jgi:hypothetical protein
MRFFNENGGTMIGSHLSMTAAYLWVKPCPDRHGDVFTGCVLRFGAWKRQVR